MLEETESYEYHLIFLSVRMKVKFPCKMKIQHKGFLLTAEVPANNQNKFIFNQDIVLKNQSTFKEQFQFTIHLITEKGARYIGGVVKLYHSQMIRSQGQKLSLSLSKCIDNQAFCEVRVDQVLNSRSSNSIPFERKGTLSRNVPSYKQRDAFNIDLSPYKNGIQGKNQQSKSEYQFPIYQNNNQKYDWDNKTRSKLLPPPSSYSRVRTPNKVNYVTKQYVAFQTKQISPQESPSDREKFIENEAYKQGYQKLKEKYKKQTEIYKQEMNKRVSLQSSQNNLKLELMRMKIRLDQQEKQLSDKNLKIKQFQNILNTCQQKEMENNYLIEQLNKRQGSIKILEETIESLTTDIQQLRDLTRNKHTEEGYRIREIRIELENMKVKCENAEKQLEKEIRIKKQILHDKEIEIIGKNDQIQRNRKIINELEKTIATKSTEIEKYIQNDRNVSKSKNQEYKLKIQELSKQLSVTNEEKKQLSKHFEELKSQKIKNEYDRKIFSHQFQSLRQEIDGARNLKEKYNDLNRQHKGLLDDYANLSKQYQKLSHFNEENQININLQFQDQIEASRKVNREFEQKIRSQRENIADLETQLEQSKAQQEKTRRNVENLNREVFEAKQRQKQAKKTLKTKEQETLGIQTEYAAIKQKLKTIDQIYKLQADKLRDEADKYRAEFEQITEKMNQLAEHYNQTANELNRFKIKCQYAEERTEKDSISLKEKQMQVQDMIKDYQEQISQQDKLITRLKASQKQLLNKTQLIEIETIKKQEKFEKNRKELRILQQKYNSLLIEQKNKANDFTWINQQRLSLQNKLNSTQMELSSLRNQNILLSSEKKKILKIQNVIQDDLNQIRQQLANNSIVIVEKQKNQEQLQRQLKFEREKFIKLEMNLSLFKKQTEKHKQMLYEHFQKHIIPIAIQSNNQEAEPKQMKKIDKLKEQSKVGNQYQFSDIIQMIISNGKQLKQVVSKQNQTNKLLQREKQKIQQQINASAHKYQNSQTLFNNQIIQLQQELEKMLQEKQSEANNFTIIINEMNEKLQDKQMLEQQLNTQIQELNFTINSLKLDCQAINDQNYKRLTNMRKLNLQLQDKVQYQLITMTDLSQKNSSLQADIVNLQEQLANQKLQIARKDHQLQQAKNAKNIHETQIEQLKTIKKILTETVSDLEMHFNSEKQLSQKLKQSLQEQQYRCNELKSFNSNLMKQKELSIKSDIQKSQIMIGLQTEIQSNNRDIQLLKQQNERISKSIQLQKDMNKKLSICLKQIQKELKQEKGRHLKTQDNLRNRQKDVINKSEVVKKLQENYQRLSQKAKNDLKYLQQELEAHQLASQQHSKQSSQKISLLTAEVQKRNIAVTELQAKNHQIQQSLFVMNQKYVEAQQSLQSYKLQCDELNMKISLLDTNNNQLTDEVKEREEKLFDYSGKNYSLELKLQAKQMQNSQTLQNLNTNWVNKYDAMCQQYQQRLELTQKERDYHKNMNDEKERESSRLASQIKLAESNDLSTRKMFQQKFKRLEEEKYTFLALKNGELQKAHDQSKIMQDNLKQKQSELRKSFNEIESARKILANYQSKFKENEQKIKSMSKVYQVQIEQLKKRETASKNYRQAISNHQWNSQRQIKRNVQNFIKAFLQLSDDKNSQKMIELVRSLEATILQTFKIIQK